jgi:hypothetical protein
MLNFKRVIFSFLLLLQVCPSWGTCTQVQAAGVNACTAGATNCAIGSGQGMVTTGAGHIIFVGESTATASITISSISGGGTYSSCSSCPGSSAGNSTDLQYTLNSSAASTITVTRSASGSGWSVHMVEVSCTGSTAVDSGSPNGGNVNNASANPNTGVSLTIAGTNDVIFQVAASGATINSVGAPYNLLGANNNRKYAVAYNITSGTAPSYTLGVSGVLIGSALAVNDAQPPVSGGHNSTLPLLGVGE